MKSLLIALASVWVLLSSIAWSQEITVLQPDGTPASGANVYVTLLESSEYENGMGLEMEDMMMGPAGGDEMGSGMMEMDMMGGTPSRGSSRPDALSFINGKPLQPIDGTFGKSEQTSKNGTVTLSNRSRRARTHFSHSVLIRHSSGFSFIPGGSSVKPQVTLRPGGSLTVETAGIADPSRYRVLSLWQNGFAYPNLPEYDAAELFDSGMGMGGMEMEMSGSSGMGMEMGAGPYQESATANLNRDDWRFRAKFCWYQLASVGERFEMPPGEVRVTLVPPTVDGTPIEQLDAEQLTQLIRYGGPSTLVIVSSAGEEVAVHFDASFTLRCQLPKIQETGLPDWGDQPPPNYELLRVDDKLSQPSRADVASEAAFVSFLNRNRKQRSSYQPKRFPTAMKGDSLLFTFLKPWEFTLAEVMPDARSTLFLPVLETQRTGQETRWTLGTAQSDPGSATKTIPAAPSPANTASPSSGNAAADAADVNGLDPWKQLQTVRQIRLETEETMRRLWEQRRRLQAIEKRLFNAAKNSGVKNGFFPNGDPFGGGQPDANPLPASNDPFGAPPAAMNDPFAPGLQTGEDPFGAKDPIDDAMLRMNDPFDGGPEAFPDATD